MDEVEFQSQFRPSGPVTVQDVFARALLPDRDELAEAAAQRAAEDARAEERELRRMLNVQAGDPLGQLSRAETIAAAARDEVADLETRLAEARGRFHRAAELVVDFRAAADEVMSASARRSNAPDLLAPAKQALAEQRVERMLAERSARPAGAPRRGRRPFGGEVSRSHLECVHCLRENVDPETSALLHLDPERPVPITTAADEAQLAASGHRDQAERRTYSYAGEISR